MADYEGIQLIGTRIAGGSLLFLATPASTTGIVHLAGDTEVEVRKDLSAAVVRGIPGSDYESVMALAPELTNRGLDIFSITGQDRLALDDMRRMHIAWWPSREGLIVRFWCSAIMVLAVNGTGEVRRPNGELKISGAEPPVPWQESMRYFRMSELTDDLFDAFRNMYLALESLLNYIEPILLNDKGRPAESDGVWFKRALRKASSNIDLTQFARNRTSDPVHAIYDELHNQIRNRVFHAKSVMQPFLPQSLVERDRVLEAKIRYTRLYLVLSKESFGSRFPSGGLSFSTAAVQASLTAVTRDWRVAVTSDSGTTDTAAEAVSPNGEPYVALPASQFCDPHDGEFKAIIARAAVEQITRVIPSVGRVVSVDSDEEPRLISSLEGRLSLTGFDRCEFVISAGMKGRQHRKSFYAT